MDNQQTQNAVVTSNLDSVNANALRMRLDTNPLIERIEVFLRGSYNITVQNDQGLLVNQKVIVGEPKANDIGVQSIMNFVSSIINPHVVQGNFDREMYEEYIRETNINLACNTVCNCTKWGIDDSDLKPIIDFIMGLIIPFTSRLINNKERESYTNTIKTMESSSSSREKKDGFKLFGR